MNNFLRVSLWQKIKTSLFSGWLHLKRLLWTTLSSSWRTKQNFFFIPSSCSKWNMKLICNFCVKQKSFGISIIFHYYAFTSPLPITSIVPLPNSYFIMSLYTPAPSFCHASIYVFTRKTESKRFINILTGDGGGNGGHWWKEEKKSHLNF